jgi:hypothetical protein
VRACLQWDASVDGADLQDENAFVGQERKKEGFGVVLVFNHHVAHHSQGQSENLPRTQPTRTIDGQIDHGRESDRSVLPPRCRPPRKASDWPCLWRT